MSGRARQLHGSPWQGVFYLTGGGAGFLAEALGAPGASQTLLEARIPYAKPALAELLRTAPRQACNGEVARALAMAAFQRAAALQRAAPAPQEAPQLFGFGGTASLATNRSKRGPCRAHLAVQTRTHTFCGEIALQGDRANQEQALTEAAWEALQNALGLTRPAPGSRLGLQSAHAPQDWQDLVTGRQRRIQTAPHDGLLLLPGAFNPLHDGHRRMMAHAEAKLGRAGAFELSIENPDKPMLDYLAIRDRLAQFRHPAWLTRLPRFLEKARHFPGATFALGTDTLMRIADPSYYGSAQERDRQLAEMLGLGARFLVFGRRIGGAFQGLDDCALPRPLRDACIEIPQAQFRLDVSSTELREENAEASR